MASMEGGHRSGRRRDTPDDIRRRDAIGDEARRGTEALLARHPAKPDAASKRKRTAKASERHDSPDELQKRDAIQDEARRGTDDLLTRHPERKKTSSRRIRTIEVQEEPLSSHASDDTLSRLPKYDSERNRKWGLPVPPLLPGTAERAAYNADMQRRFGELEQQVRTQALAANFANVQNAETSEAFQGRTPREVPEGAEFSVTPEQVQELLNTPDPGTTGALIDSQAFEAALSRYVARRSRMTRGSYLKELFEIADKKAHGEKVRAGLPVIGAFDPARRFRARALKDRWIERAALEAKAVLDARYGAGADTEPPALRQEDVWTTADSFDDEANPPEGRTHASHEARNGVAEERELPEEVERDGAADDVHLSGERRAGASEEPANPHLVRKLMDRGIPSESLDAFKGWVVEQMRARNISKDSREWQGYLGGAERLWSGEPGFFDYSANMVNGWILDQRAGLMSELPRNEAATELPNGYVDQSGNPVWKFVRWLLPERLHGDRQRE